MKICFFPRLYLHNLSKFSSARLFCLGLLLAAFTCPSFVWGQTTVNFTAIPYSDPDIISPGRGAEQWDNGMEGIRNPAPDSSQRSLDVYYRFSWTRLEGDSLGSYDWTHFDNIMQEAIEHRQRVSFGIMPVYDGNGTKVVEGARSAYPLYLHKLMQSGTPNTRDWVSNGVWIPNWNSTYYLTRLRALHVALNEHILNTSYKGVAFRNVIYCIDVRGYGNYGEWHNAGIVDHVKDYPPGRQPTVAALRTIIAAHTQVFANWPLVLMVAVFDAEQFDAIMVPAEVTNYALTTRNAWGPLGWRRDQWGATDVYLDKLLKKNAKKYLTSPEFREWIMTRYQTSPVTGEPPRYVNEGGPCDYWDLERQINEYGATSLGNGNWGVTLNECGMQNARAAFKKAGYRLILTGATVPSSFGPGKSMTITLKWRNTGIAPVYENWDVVYELKNDSNVTVWSGTSWFKPKRFLPAATDSTVNDFFKLPTTIPVGNYTLNVVIKDPTGYRAPLPLAIMGRNDDGSYTLKNSKATPPNCILPIATVSSLAVCKSDTFSLRLDSSTGRAPYELTIGGVTYKNVGIGQTFASMTMPTQKIFTVTPTPNSYEDGSVELGMRFRSSADGYVKGIRFFSSNAPSGKYTAHLWTAAGKLIDSAVFVNVTPSGWQEVLFAKPVHITADTIYVASYHTVTGHYAATSGGLINASVNGYLTALASTAVGGNGLYSYGPSPTFPVNSYNGTNYWVDVLFSPANYALALTGITDSSGCYNSGSLQTINVTVPVCDTTPQVPVPPVLPTASISSSTFCAGQPVTVVLDSATGTGPFDLEINGKKYNDVVVGQAIVTMNTQTRRIWDSIPVAKSYEDAPVELGLKFKSSKPGFITGIRFLSASTSGGVYTGHLWTGTGQLIDSARFGAVSPSSWQEVSFSKPIAIVADSIYVASYHTAGGHYAATSGGLVTAVVNGPLSAPGSESSGGNGMYAYGNSPTFPTNSYNATNYWVDVLFTEDTSHQYTFHLTSVTDSTGKSRNGDLQTLTISSVNCTQAMRAAPAPVAVVPVKLVRRSATTPGDLSEAAANRSFALQQNFPNPFRTATVIQFSLPAASSVQLTLFDINGKLVRTVVNGSREKGTHTITLNGGTLAAGLYYYRLHAGPYSATRKLVVQ